MFVRCGVKMSQDFWGLYKYCVSVRCGVKMSKNYKLTVNCVCECGIKLSKVSGFSIRIVCL